MRLLNHTTLYFAGALLVIMTLWAGLYYYNMLDEVYDSIDDGLENYKLLIIGKAATDSTVLQRTAFDEANYAVHRITEAEAMRFHDVYKDTALYMLNENDYEPVRLLTTAFHHNDKYYRLKIISSMVEEDDLIEDLFYALLWLYAGLVVSILVINNVLLRRIWKPFYGLLEKLKDFRLDRPAPLSFEKTNVREFNTLNESIVRLLKSNLDTYASQKQFIENASHELQTPLAISLNKLELMAGEGALTEAQLDLLGSVITNLERLARLNRSLLLLTKIENKQFPAAGNTDLRATATRIVGDFTDQAEHKEIATEISGGALTVNMNPDLAEMLVLNLIKNAIIHTPRGGRMAVSTSGNTLRVENTGAKPLDDQRIFNRFYKDEQNPASTGLGLSIVKAIAGMYGFTVTYRFDDKHIFSVIF
jgi:signal transduction histidine kinase